MKTAVKFLIATMLVSFVGCQGAADVRLPATGGAKPWTNEHFRNNPADFQFAIVSDRCGGHRPGIFPLAMKKLNLLQPEFVICVGDLIEGYTEDPKAMDAMRAEVDAMIAELEMPFFRVAGNHDMSNAAMAKNWEEHYGKPWYHFVYDNTLFLVVCSEDGGQHIHLSDEQLKYIDQTLKQNSDVRWTFVFVHVPLWAPREGIAPEQSNWAKVEEMLKGRDYTVFAGHHHIYNHIKRNGMDYFTLATTGGASDLVGPEKMDHFVWVTMTDKGPRIANILLDGVFSANIVSEITEKQMRENPPISADTLLTAEPTFSAGKGKIVVRNPAPAPMAFSAEIAGANELTIKPDKIETTVPPSSVTIIELDVAAAQPLETAKIPAVPVAWKLHIDMPDGGKIDLAGTDRMHIEKGTLAAGGFSDDFAAGADRWRAMNGKWEAQNGEYHQTVKSGYDFAATADAWITGDYRIKTKLRLVEGSMESGLMFNLPTATARTACQMIRFAGPGTIWYGYFDRSGGYVLEGGAPTGITGDGKDWITLEVAVNNSRGTYDILINDKPVAQGLKLKYPARPDEPRCGLALISCQGHVAFDDASLTPTK